MEPCKEHRLTRVEACDIAQLRVHTMLVARVLPCDGVMPFNGIASRSTQVT